MNGCGIQSLFVIITLLLVLSLNAQSDIIESNVYKWTMPEINGNSTSYKKLILSGSTTDLESLQLHSVILLPNNSVEINKTKTDTESLLIIKDGDIEFRIKNNKKILGPGSIVLVMPGEEYDVKNYGNSEAAYYLFEYKSKAPLDMKRGEDAGGSFMVDWNDLTFHPHDKGGIREYFDKATAMLRRIEMHVTTLNPGIKSHEPHTHTSDEMVLMIDGNSNLQVGDSHFDAAAGDLIFLGANKPHALSNNSKRSCMYFAFHVE